MPFAPPAPAESSRAAIRCASRPWSAATMAAEVRRGLLRSPVPEIPSKYFYDDRGSALFERITRLPEYYQTRTEEGLLQSYAADCISAVGPRELVEIGSGAGRKIRFFLDAMRARGSGGRCVQLDVNESMLRGSLEALEAEYPSVAFEGIVGDFLHDLPALGTGGKRLLLLFAGTIGNLHPGALPGFLGTTASILTRGDGFLVGLDVVKDPQRLEAAYNDAAGVTAEFNRNVLRVLDRHLGADFNPADFEHVAFYDRERRWIEMRLRARRALTVRIPACGVRLEIDAGGEIRTELSCKYTEESFTSRLDGTGLYLERWMTDPSESFACALLRRA